jgi:hypothetical protein
LATLLLPIPALAAYWSATFARNHLISGLIIAAFWIFVEIFSLSTKGLSLPWHANLIRFEIDLAIIAGALSAAFPGGLHRWTRNVTVQH